MKIYAVRPPRGAVVHLFAEGYLPGAKGRSVPEASGMCGALLASEGPGRPRPMTPLAEALRWTSMQPSETDPRPAWRWCRACIGHAISATHLTAWVLGHVAKGGPG